MIQESIDQCLMITKSVTKRCRADNNKKKHLMNKSRTLLNKKRIIIDKDSISSKLIGQQELKKSQILFNNTNTADYVHKLSSNSKYKYNDNKIQKSNLKSKSKLFRKISTSTLIRGQTSSFELDKFSFLDHTLYSTKKSILLNSTEMDKKGSIKFSAFCQDSDYASNGPSDSECLNCLKNECNDCVCEACSSNVFRDESWDKTNFLSSTPLIIDYKANMNSTENTSTKSSKKKPNGFKLIQNYLSLKKTDDAKKANDLKRVMKIKDNIRLKRFKNDLFNKNAKLSNDNKNFESYTSMFPINSSENFTKYGDFLIWYV